MRVRAAGSYACTCSVRPRGMRGRGGATPQHGRQATRRVSRAEAAMAAICGAWQCRSSKPKSPSRCASAPPEPLRLGPSASRSGCPAPLPPSYRPAPSPASWQHSPCHRLRTASSAALRSRRQLRCRLPVRTLKRLLVGLHEGPPEHACAHDDQVSQQTCEGRADYGEQRDSTATVTVRCCKDAGKIIVSTYHEVTSCSNFPRGHCGRPPGRQHLKFALQGG